MESGCEKRDGRWVRGGCKERSEWLETARSLRCESDEDGFIRSPVARRGCHPSSVEYSAELWSGTVWDRSGERERERQSMCSVSERRRSQREREREKGEKEGRECEREGENERSRKLMSHTELKLRERKR